MKASVVQRFGGGFELADVDIAMPIGREVLIDVRASGLCHSDQIAASRPLGSEPPMVLGHEAAGVVTAIGPDVTDVTVGDHVVACLVRSCGSCRQCVSGRSVLCQNAGSTQRSPDDPPRLTFHNAAVAQGFCVGGFAQQALVHESQVAVVPPALPWPQAALLGCGVATGAGAVFNSANVQPSDSVVIVGAGGVGLNALTAAVIAGASTIIAVDIADEKLERARRFGATHVINSRVQDAVDIVRAITGSGADAVFDFVGASPVTEHSLQMVAPGGGLYLLGLLDPAATMTLTPTDLLLSKRRIVGVYMGDISVKRDIPKYAELYLAGRFELDGLVSREIALEDVQAGYDMLADPSIARVVITKFT